MKSTIFWDATPCSLVEVERRFEGTVMSKMYTSLLLADFLLSSFSDLEDGSNTFL
jgi:hypothetical protein